VGGPGHLARAGVGGHGDAARQHSAFPGSGPLRAGTVTPSSPSWDSGPFQIVHEELKDWVSNPVFWFLLNYMRMPAATARVAGCRGRLVQNHGNTLGLG
jgi:hypothetical protein